MRPLHPMEHSTPERSSLSTYLEVGVGLGLGLGLVLYSREVLSTYSRSASCRLACAFCVRCAMTLSVSS